MSRALRDPDNANLDRVHVVKGWLKDDGETEACIYDVVCADDRAIVDSRCESPVGNTVNVAEASYTNTIGDPLLTVFWEDPDFDPPLRADYYVHLLEIPTPTLQADDQEFVEIAMSGDIPLSHQECAHISPIWYTPES